MSKGDEIDFNQYNSQPVSRLEIVKDKPQITGKGLR